MSNTVTVEKAFVTHFKQPSGRSRPGVDWAIQIAGERSGMVVVRTYFSSKPPQEAEKKALAEKAVLSFRGSWSRVGFHGRAFWSMSGFQLRRHDGLRQCEKVDATRPTRYNPIVNAVEFTTELSGTTVLKIPSAAAAQLPKFGKVRVILLTNEDNDDAARRTEAYQQFMR